MDNSPACGAPIDAHLDSNIDVFVGILGVVLF